MLTVRQTNENDVDLVSEIYSFYVAIATESPLIIKSLAEISQSILNGKSFIAINGTEIVGYITFRDWENYLELMTLIVKKEYRRQGIGKKLSKFMLESLSQSQPEKQIVGFPNPTSMPIMVAIGFTQHDRSAIPMYLKEVYATELANPKYAHVMFAMYPKKKSA